MRRNVSIPILISLLAHAYIGWRLLPDAPLGSLGVAAGFTYLLLSALLVPTPLLLRLAVLPERAASALAWTGYLAMGMFSTLFVLCVLRDGAVALLWAWERWHPGSLHLDSVRSVSALLVPATAVLVSALGLVNARRLARVKHVDVPIVGLPAALSGFSIVQLSDVHVGPTIKRGYLEAIVQRVNGLGADLIAITGDLIDGSLDQLRPHVLPLADLHARHGVFCVTGNHEYYHGVDAWVDEWRRLGLRVLLNENEVIQHDGEQLLIAGVTDYNAHHYSAAHRSDPTAAAQSSERVAAKILLAHQPRSALGAATAGFDLQLSGHTHGGQFWPWNLFVPMQQPFVSGLERVNDLLVYVSTGTGYWGPPLRFLAPSEITCVRLVRGPSQTTQSPDMTVRSEALRA